MCEYFFLYVCITVRGGPKSKPLPNKQQLVLNRIKACRWD